VWTVYDVPAEGAENNAIKEEGWYLNDKKAGIWYTFLEGGVVLGRFDFEEQQELPPLIKPKYVYPRGLRPPVPKDWWR